MSRTNLIRWSGLSSLFAGVLFAVAGLIHPAGEGVAAYSDPRWIPAHLIGLASVILLQLGLVGLYARQTKETGWLGLVGFVLAFAGTALAAGIQLVVSTALPVVAAEASAIFEQASAWPPFALALFVLGFGLGYVLFGIAVMRARVLPRWSGLLLSVGVALFMFAEVSRGTDLLTGMSPYVIGLTGEVLMGISWGWMGYALWAVEGRAAVQAARRDTTARQPECDPAEQAC